MKKYIAALSFVSYLFLAPAVFAQTTITTCQTGGQFSFLCGLTTNNFGGIVGSLIQLIFAISVIVALLYLVYGGFRWLTSGGDKGAVTAAREHIVAAIIGLVIIFLAYFVINLLLGFFNVGSLSQLTLPNVQLQ